MRERIRTGGYHGNPRRHGADHRRLPDRSADDRATARPIRDRRRAGRARPARQRPAGHDLARLARLGDDQFPIGEHASAHAGFVVAIPEHRGDNWRETDAAGPESWKRRPREISRAIDAVSRDVRFGPLVNTDKVGVYGMSAGGLTALLLAGADWNLATVFRHCAAHATDDAEPLPRRAALCGGSGRPARCARIQARCRQARKS